MLVIQEVYNIYGQQRVFSVNYTVMNAINIAKLYCGFQFVKGL